jgi:hypothetical protein
MEIRPSFLIPAMVKAMTETVLPAVDPENKLAVEQARLVIGMLQLISIRLPLLTRYDRIELRHQVELAKRVSAECHGGPSTVAALEELQAAAGAAENALGRVDVDPREIEASLLAIRGRIGTLVIAVNEDGERESRGALRRSIVSESRAEIDRARAWVLPQGWESDPGDLPSIEALLCESSKT